MYIHVCIYIYIYVYTPMSFPTANTLGNKTPRQTKQLVKLHIYADVLKDSHFVGW